MATWTDGTKNTTTLTNQAKGSSEMTWDEATMTWDDAEGTWDDTGTIYSRQAKNTTVLTNESKS